MQRRIIPYILLLCAIFFCFIPIVYADEASEWYVKGQNAATMGDYQTALQDYNNALAADKNYINAYVGKAVALNHLGMYQDALASADTVLAVKTDPDAAEARAFALFSLGRYEESAAAYDLFFTLRQNVAGDYCNQGMAYEFLNMTTKAIASFNSCVKLDPRNLDGWNQKGVVYLTLGDYQDALDSFNHCTQITLTNATVWNNKGLAYAGLEDYPDAMDCFKTALNLDPNFKDAQANLDKAYLRKPFFTTTTTATPTPVVTIPAQGTTTVAVTEETTGVTPAVTPVEQETTVQEAAGQTTYSPLPSTITVFGLLAGLAIFLAKGRLDR